MLKQFNNGMLPTSDKDIFVISKTTKFDGHTIPKNSMVFFCRNKDVYICRSFPINYEGDNPRLDVLVWDNGWQAWLEEPIRNNVTKAMWLRYRVDGYNRPTMSDAIPKNCPIRRHKSRSDGMYADNVGSITDYACGKMPQWVDWK